MIHCVDLKQISIKGLKSKRSVLNFTSIGKFWLSSPFGLRTCLSSI